MACKLLRKAPFLSPFQVPQVRVYGYKKGTYGKSEWFCYKSCLLECGWRSLEMVQQYFCSCNDLGSIPRTHISLPPPITPDALWPPPQAAVWKWSCMQTRAKQLKRARERNTAWSWKQSQLLSLTNWTWNQTMNRKTNQSLSKKPTNPETSNLAWTLKLEPEKETPWIW